MSFFARPQPASAISAMKPVRQLMSAGLAVALALPLFQPLTGSTSLARDDRPSASPGLPAPAVRHEPPMPGEPPALTADTPALPAPGAAPIAARRPPAPAAWPEITTARTADSATYDLGGGRYVLVQDAAPRHYQDPDGTWQPINPAFAAVDGGWLKAADSLRVSVAAASSDARLGAAEVALRWTPQALLAVDADGESETLARPLAPLSALPGVRTADGQAVMFPASWDLATVQDEWRAGPGRAEYRLRLSALPAIAAPASASLDLSARLTLQPGTTVRVGGQPAALPLETDQAIEFVSAEGETIVLHPPAVFEAGDPEKRAPGRYRLAATDQPRTLELRARFPWAWLASPDRQFPVVLDPLFQVKTGSVVKVSYYSKPPSGQFPTYLETQDFTNTGRRLELGHFGDGHRNVLVRFDLPSMPPGTRVTAAYLSAAPSGVNIGDYLERPIRAFALSDNVWWQTPGAISEPQTTGGPLPALGLGLVRYAGGLSIPGVWDVTGVVQGWEGEWGPGLQPDSANHGFLIAGATGSDDCPELNPDRGCAGFFFNNPSNWQPADLEITDALSQPGGPVVTTFAQGSGLRLLVFYSGPTLAETPDEIQNVAADLPVPGNPENFFKAEHEFRWTTTPDRWQAVVVRGLGAPTADTPDLFERPVRGSFRLALRDEAGAELGNRQSEAGLAYVVTKAAAPESFSVRVGPMAGSPTRYDARLVGQRGASTVAQDASVTFTHVISSDTPLTLWNLDLPPGARSRVEVRVESVNAFDGFDPTTYYPYARFFQARLWPGPREAVNGFMSNRDTGVGSLNLSSGIFTAEAGDYALALAYAGPSVRLPPPPPPGPNSVEWPTLSDARSKELAFTLRVTVTACGLDAAGNPTFPTADGRCVVVKCPTPATTFALAGPFGLWAQPDAAPLNGEGETLRVSPTRALLGPAPLLGPADAQSAPTVAVLGGLVDASGNVMPDPAMGGLQPDLLLVRCGPPSDPNPLQAYFQAFQQTPMAVDASARLAPAPAPGKPVPDPAFLNAWTSADRADLSAVTYFADPVLGQAGGGGQLLRHAGDGPQAADSTFSVSWTVTADGWPSLAGTAAQTGGSAPSIAGLTLDLGSAFSLLVDQSTFAGLAAHAARVTQPAGLGGAGRPVQALLFPRGWSHPASNAPCQDTARAATSCLDLRAPDDLNRREWTLPDIHLTGPVGTLAVGVPGALAVYSTDHPVVSGQAAGASFSYDTFGARVSVAQRKCDEADPNAPLVTVVEGVTLMTLPNIGGSADPSTLISAEIKLCDGLLRRVFFKFQTPVGVPIGNSGLFLTGLEGGVTLGPGYTTITFGLDFQAAPGGDGGLLKGRGDVTIDTRGLFAFHGEFGVLKGVLGGRGDLWVSWSPLDIGFKAQLGYPRRDPWLSAFARAHLWTGRGWGGRYAWLPDNNETHIAAQLQAQLRLPEGSVLDWGPLEVPPDDVQISIDLTFGQFCTNDGCTQYEWGIKGRFAIMGYDVGLYYTFGRDLTNPEFNPGNLSLILGNDSHVLIDQHGGASDLPASALTAVAAEDAGTAAAPIYRPPPAVNGVAVVPLTVNPGVEQMLVGLGWAAGAPQLTLVDPTGAEVTPGNALSFNAEFSNTLNATLVSVRAPQPGAWQARLSALSADGSEAYKFFFFANRGAPVKPGENLFLAPANPDEPGTGLYPITWRVPAGAPPTARINLYALGPTTKPVSDTLDIGTPIALHRPLSDGRYVWNTTGWPNGTYQVYAVVEDGLNAAPAANRSEDACTPLADPLPSSSAFDPARFPGTVTFTAPGTVRVDDAAAPPVPTGLSVTGIDGALLVRWAPSTDRYVTAYVVEWDSPAGVQSQQIVATRQPGLRLGGLENGVSTTVRVAAVRVNGQVSAFTPDVAATPDGAADPLPPPPEAFTRTTATSTSATFTWIPGAGSSPAGYRLSYARLDRSGEAGELVTTETQATLTGLATGAAYAVSVSAANAAGWYGASAAPVRVLVTNGQDGDGDGLPADWAGVYGVSEPDEDADGDGLTNLHEFRAFTDPTRQDSDGDGLSDLEEVATAGESDPLDANSARAIPTQPRLALGEDRVRLVLDLRTPDPAPTTVIPWSNRTAGALSLQAEAGAPWLTAAVLSDTVAVNVDKARLKTAGFYSGVIRLAPAAGSDPVIGPPACVRVDVWAVGQAPPDDGGEEDERVRRGLRALYTFEEGRGSQVRDVAGAGAPLDLRIADTGAVRWVAGGLRITSPTSLTSSGPATRLIKAANASGAYSLEFWIRPSTAARARGSLLALAQEPRTLNVAVGQVRGPHFNRFALFEVSDGKPLDWLTTPDQAVPGDLIHLVYTRDRNGTLRVYVNGVKQAEAATGEGPLGWDAGASLTLASAPGGRFPWEGEYQLVAFYSTRLSAAEIRQNYAAGP